MSIFAQHNEEGYKYFINFFAHMLQYPHIDIKPAAMVDIPTIFPRPPQKRSLATLFICDPCVDSRQKLIQVRH